VGGKVLLRDSKLIVVALVTSGIVISSLGYFYYMNQTDVEKTAISKVFPEQSEEGEEFLGVAKKESKGVAEETNIRPLEAPSKVDIFKEHQPKFDDTAVSRLWFDVRDKNQKLSARQSKFRELVEGVSNILGSGKTPSVVDKFPAVLTSRDKYGFFQDFYTYPNGSVNMVTMVAPEVVKDSDRTVIFVAVKVGSSTTVKVFRGLNTIPTNSAIVSGKNNYLLISGSCLDENIYTTKETQGLFGLKLKGDGATLVNVRKDILLKNAQVRLDGNVLRVKGSPAPQAFTDSPGDDQIATVIYLTTIGADDKETDYKTGIVGDVLELVQTTEFNN
jgi:hypothetical protein